MYHEIKGIIYRVNFQYGSCFVECDEGNAHEELYRFCAKKAASGKVISSVNRIFEDSSSTPRVSVLSQPEYKQAYREELARKDEETWKRVTEYTPLASVTSHWRQYTAQRRSFVPQGTPNLRITRMTAM